MSYRGYFTFGQAHEHRWRVSTNAKRIMLLDKDAVVEIGAENSDYARELMFNHFGNHWAMQYDRPPDRRTFPRGVCLILPVPGPGWALTENRRRAHDSMHFTPFDGHCPACGADLVAHYGPEIYATGVNITGCPACHRSYCD